MGDVPVVRYTISTKTVLNDPEEDWVEQPHLICPSFTPGASPTVSQAELFWRYGKMNRSAYSGVDVVRDETADYVPAFDLIDKWVRIEIASLSYDWIGCVRGDTETRRAQETTEAEQQRVKAGDQGFIAYGLEWFLGRSQVSGTSSREADKKYRPLSYNAGHGDGRDYDTAARGNQGEAELVIDGDELVYADGEVVVDGGDGELGFSTADSATEWDAAEIVVHLLSEQCPRNAADDPSPVQYRLDGAAYPFLKWYQPVIRVEGRTLIDILDDVINRRRGLVWWVEPLYDDDTDPFNPVWVGIVKVTSIFPEDFELPNPEDLDPAPAVPANANQIAFEPDADLACQPVQIVRDATRRYNRFRCRGARRTSTFSAVGGDALTGVGAYTFPVDVNSEIVRGWRRELAVEMLSGVRPTLSAPDQAVYDALDEDEQASWDDRYRQSEKFDRVYKYFAISPVTTSTERLSPIISQSDPGSILGDISLDDTQKRTLRVLRTTTLVVGADYTDATDVDASAVEDDQSREFLPPLLLCYLPRGTGLWPVTMGEFTDGGEDPSSSTDGGWRFAEKLSTNMERVFAVGSEDETVIEHRFRFNFSLSTQAGYSGIVIHCHGISPINLNIDDLGDPDTAPTVNDTDHFNWKNFLATFTVEWEAYCEAVWPVAPPTAEPVEELLVSIGERARFDWVVKGTVFDLDKNGHPRQVETPGAIRDDRNLCEQLAKLAHEWYSTTRAQASLRFTATRKPFNIGDLVTTIGTEEAAREVNAVCTQIVWDLENGSTSVTLAHAELDFTDFA
jgi:hypothetical protein